MELPPYDEFIKSLEGNDLEQLKSACMMSVTEYSGPITSEFIENIMQSQAKFVATFCAQYVDVMLRAYHEWIREQI